MRNLYTSLVILLISLNAFSQDSIGQIDAQRPTLTESFSIIKTNMIQFENGLDYYGTSRTFSYGTFVRGSINSFFELRLMTDYKRMNYIGGKFSFLKPENTNTQLGAAIVYHHMLDSTQNDVRIALTRDFTGISLTYNFGYNGSIYNILYFGKSIKNNLCIFAEYYNDAYINRIHSGIMYYPNKEIQLDINGGWIDKTGWYSGIGVSFRIR